MIDVSILDEAVRRFPVVLSTRSVSPDHAAAIRAEYHRLVGGANRRKPR